MLLPQDGPLSTLVNCRWAFHCIVSSSLSNMAFVVASSSVFSHGSLQFGVASTEAGQSASREEISCITAVAGPRTVLWRLPDIVSDLSRPSCEPVPSPPSAFGAPREQAVAQPPRSGFSTTRGSLESPDGHGWCMSGMVVVPRSDIFGHRSQTAPSPPVRVVIASGKGSKSPALKPVNHQLIDRWPKSLSAWHVDGAALVHRPVSLTDKRRQPDEPGTILVNRATVENAQTELEVHFVGTWVGRRL